MIKVLLFSGRMRDGCIVNRVKAGSTSEYFSSPSGLFGIALFFRDESIEARP
jgi:hypothetical protein